jgi:GTP cyclohydrolase IA
VADLLAALDEDPTSEHPSDTPRRVAQPYTEQPTPREFDLTTFPNDEGYDELVPARTGAPNPAGRRRTARAPDPQAAGVVIEAEQLCMSLRGVRATGSRPVTSALHGLLREDARSRQEFFGANRCGALTGVTPQRCKTGALS